MQFLVGKLSSRRTMAERTDRAQEVPKATLPPYGRTSFGNDAKTDSDLADSCFAELDRMWAREVLSAKSRSTSDANHSFGHFKLCLHRAGQPLRVILNLVMASWCALWFVVQVYPVVLAPVCNVPAMPHFLFPMCSLPHIAASAHDAEHASIADFPSLAEITDRSLTPLAASSARSKKLSRELQETEFATSDLITLVRISDVPSREMIVESLGTFVKNARDTGRALQHLHARVHGAVDTMLATNNYALRQIDDAPDPSFLSVIMRRNTKARVAVIEFETVMNVMKMQMEQLLRVARDNYQKLDMLGEDLATLHHIFVRAENLHNDNRDGLLSSFWTQLGGNRDAMRLSERSSAVLKDIKLFRSQAQTHVISALDTLNRMEADMFDLRDRVAVAALTGIKVPLEVQLQAIRASVERLKESRIDS
jgi:hypothetical protein